MKSTGIIRKVDELGRVVIPKELRTMLAIEERDPIEIFTDGEQIVLQKYKPDREKDNVVNALQAMVDDNQFDYLDTDALKRAIKLIR